MKLRITIVTAFLLVLLAIGYGQAVRPQTLQQPSNPQGRYQIVFSPIVRADTFLLDTETGKVWQRTEYTDVQGNPGVWLFQDRLDNSQQEQLWIGTHLLKKQQ